ncbi:hypothetical protein GCM10025883_38270 [Mobilicoccus caccae]|uniref:Uncharacterized protein n=1 Tax=Mobilicoccus caccae TaxID=1859295 RepID=A0ABQ6IYL7_9MICO|nr:hypothetical protein GCM10025883_38270 [Mobilicoccus caccae]
MVTTVSAQPLLTPAQVEELFVRPVLTQSIAGRVCTGYVNFIWPRVVGLAGPRLGARSQPRVNSGQLMGGSSCQWCRRRRRELVMTLTELRAMAAAAIIGDNSQPKAG